MGDNDFDSVCIALYVNPWPARLGLASTTVSLTAGRLTSSSYNDTVDPTLISIRNESGRQDGPASSATKPIEDSLEELGEPKGLSTTWPSPLPEPQNLLHSHDEAAMDGALFDEWLSERQWQELVDRYSGTDMSPEFWNENYQVQSSTNQSLPDQVGRSDFGTLSDYMGFFATTSAPQPLTNDVAIESLCPEDIPDTRQNSTMDCSSQYHSDSGGQVCFNPLPSLIGDIGDDDSKAAGLTRHSASFERPFSPSLQSYATEKSPELSHNSIPVCGIIVFSSTENGINESTNTKLRKGKRRFSARGERTDLIPRKRAPNGAICVRCKLFREKCSSGYACENCQCVNSQIWSKICVRAGLTNLSCYEKQFFRPRLPIYLKNVRNWCEPAIKPVKIKVSVGYKPTLQFLVSRYVPIDVGLLDHMSWRYHCDDELVRTPSPPWGVRYMGFNSTRIDLFMDEMVEELLNEPTFLQKDAIWVHTFKAALARSKSKRPDALVVKNSLRMWVAQSIWFDRIWRIVEEGEGIDAPWRNSIKARDVPKLLYMQLDHYMEKYIENLETRILADLDRFIFGPSRDAWFSIYTAAFVYLVALENDSWRLETLKTKLKAWKDLLPEVRRGLPVWPLPNSPDYYLEQNRHHAHIVAAHVRAGCRGLFPFSTNALGQVVANTKVNDEEIKAFVANIREELPDFSQNMMLRGAALGFRHGDVNSLDYSFAAQLFMDRK